MANEQHRHDITDAAWVVIEPHTIGNKELGRERARYSKVYQRSVLDSTHGRAVAGLPPEYGDWKNTHRRFCRWRDKRIWERMLEALIDEPDFEWLMIDASHIKVHPHAAGAVGGNQDMERTKGGSTPRYIWPWMRMVCQYDSLLQRVPQRIAQLQHN